MRATVGVCVGVVNGLRGRGEQSERGDGRAFAAVGSGGCSETTSGVRWRDELGVAERGGGRADGGAEVGVAVVADHVLVGRDGAVGAAGADGWGEVAGGGGGGGGGVGGGGHA